MMIEGEIQTPGPMGAPIGCPGIGPQGYGCIPIQLPPPSEPPHSVPEPNTLGGMLIGLALLALFRRTKKPR